MPSQTVKNCMPKLKNSQPSNGYFFLSITIEHEINNLNQILTTSPQNTSYVNKKCWHKLKAMAFETYVPESDTSRSGAGY